MKVKKARKEYSKAKSYEERDEIAGSFVESLLKRIENSSNMNPSQWRAVIKSIVIDAQYFAAANVEYEQGWKIHRDWMKCIIAQIIGLSEHTRALYTYWGWNYDQCISPMFSDGTKWHTVEFKEKESGEIKQIKILLESIGVMALGSKWKNKHGQEFTVTSVENDEVYLEAMDNTGKWFDVCYPKNKVLSMKKVA
jgi:hypothetical protein